MASIKRRNNTFSVIYTYTDETGARKQKWETYKTYGEAKKRKKEIDYKESQGTLIVAHCKTVRELLQEYVELYGKDKWSLSTYDRNVATIHNYILPVLGDVKLKDLNTRVLEIYYKQLKTTPAVPNPMTRKPKSEFVTTSIIRDIHKILRNCFEQAVKWELMEKNPATYATVPVHKPEKREIWTAETLMHAIDVCEDDVLKIALNLAFAGSLRIGELLALTWDCIDISPEAIEEDRAYLIVNKEVQRVSKEAMKDLDHKDIIIVFPENKPTNKTVRVLKSPKTDSSIRKVYLPKSVARMLEKHRQDQEEMIDLMGDDYHDYNLVLTTAFGLPIGGGHIRKALDKLIKEYDLPPVVFHSLRHSSVTYKLKITGGDIKSVQGDSGHAQASMVTNTYGHILDDERRRNARLFEEAFYERRDLNPQMHERNEWLAGKIGQQDQGSQGGQMGQTSQDIQPGTSGLLGNLPEGADLLLLLKVLENPGTAELLTALAKTMKRD